MNSSLHGSLRKGRYLVLTALVGASLNARASFYVNLQTKDDWDTAVNDGRITAVTQPYDALEVHYRTLYPNFIQVTPELKALNNIQSGGLGNGLLMSWGDSSQNVPQVATWQYTYAEDPNLVGTTLKITVTPPAGILSVSLTLNSAAVGGPPGWVSWAWPVGGQGGLTPGAQTTITIDPVTLVAVPFALPVNAGFNAAAATTIQADELAVGAPPPPNQWQFFPPVGAGVGAKPWNYWGQLQVVPEPGTWLAGLLALGVLGHAVLRQGRVS